MSVSMNGSQDQRTAVAEAVITAASNINTSEEKRWHLDIEAPRWALSRAKHEAWAPAGLFLVALLLAAAGVMLAWHASDQVATQSGHAPPLTDQIGPWAVAMIVIGGAVAAGIAAFRAVKMHLHMAVEPSATAEAERAQELHDRLMSALTNHAAAAPVPVGVATTATAAQAAASLQQGGNGGVVQSPPQSVPLQPSGLVDQASTTAPAATVVEPRTTVSPKVGVGTAVTLASASFWTIAAATFWHSLQPAILAALGTGITALAGAIGGWWKTDPLRVTHIKHSRPAGEKPAVK